MLCLRGFKLYSQYVTLIKLKGFQMVRSAIFRLKANVDFLQLSFLQ